MHIEINSRSFSWIEVYKCNYQLDKNNSSPVICRDCKQEIPAGIGIHRQAYKRSGYLCFACFAKDVVILTTRFDGEDAGFFIDSLGRLRACSLSRPDYMTADIIHLVYNALLDEAHTSIDTLLGEESAPVWKIDDAAEAMIGIHKGEEV